MTQDPDPHMIWKIFGVAFIGGIIAYSLCGCAPVAVWKVREIKEAAYMDGYYTAVRDCTQFWIEKHHVIK